MRGTMTEPRKREPRAPKHVIHLNGTLACIRCGREWDVTDLNPKRKVVKCPVDGTPNDTREAIKRAV
jgi:hypothetical protein